MKTLAIETSCDDTSLAVVEFVDGNFKITKNLLHSQIAQHSPFGGVIPELASRLHEEKIIDLLENIWMKEIESVDFISFTESPGLPGSLLVWKVLANTLSIFLNKPKTPIFHIHGHIFSIFCERNLQDLKFPILVLTVSGWHNEIYLISWKDYKNEILEQYCHDFSRKYDLELVSRCGPYKITKLGFTLDDAAGEAFDKVSRLLNWPYPWWRRIWEKAAKWKKMDFDFPRIFLKKDEFNFSFSWLKAQCNYKITELKKEFWELSEQLVCDLAFEFQQAVVETLWKKLLKASDFFGVKNIALVGGVSANTALKDYIWENLTKFEIENFYTPIKNIYSTDNAGMIGVVWILKNLKI